MTGVDARALDWWLADLLGPGHGRRLAGVTAERIVLSKVPEGIPGRAVEAAMAVRGLFDVAALLRAAPLGVGGVRAWEAAARAVLAEARRDGVIDEAGLAAVVPGVESLGALLASCCWTDDGSPWWVPSEPELVALAEAASRLEPAGGTLFSRRYGEFAGRSVESHCPGAPVARRMFEAACAFLLHGRSVAGAPCPGGGLPVP